MTDHKTKNNFIPRNQTVSAAYRLILKVTKQLIATIPQELLRHTIELDFTTKLLQPPKKHEFINTLLYLCLREQNDCFYIHFGFDQSKEFSHITGDFTRMVYKLTMKDHTPVDIEDCVITYSIVTDTSGLIDHMQWKHPSLKMVVIKFKKGSVKSDTKEATPVVLEKYMASEP